MKHIVIDSWNEGLDLRVLCSCGDVLADSALAMAEHIILKGSK